MCGALLSPPDPSPESRRIVTVLFVDLVGSTSLAENVDPEALRTAMDRYYAACTAAIADQGGVTEKFIGDAVMAVFGAHRTTGDEAFHAVKAALAVRSSLSEINSALAQSVGIRLEIRCGLQSGEAVVVGLPGPEGARVIGDVVNTAARLQSAADVNQILIGDETARLVDARVLIAPVRPAVLRGKRDPVAAHRVIGLAAETTVTDVVPILGRKSELDQLQTSLTTCQASRTGRFVGVTGPPGIGKSRLVREFVDGQAGTSAYILRAVCHVHGRGLTYQPIAELVRSVPGGWDDVVDRLRPAELGGERAISALAAALDLDRDRTVGVADIAWAVRCLFGALARQRPLIVVVEDLHYAEPTFLTLLREAVSTVSAPVLVLATARPEFHLVHSALPADGAAAMWMNLEALSAAHTERLVRLLAARPGSRHHGAHPSMLTRVAQSCEGNPLYAELLLSSRTSPDEPASLPTTIRVLLEAWLDRLPEADREVLRHAATIGPAFSVGQLLPAEADEADGQRLHACLERLRTGGTIRYGGADGFHFTQSLVRETLYEMTAKSRRADWHLAEADRLARIEALPPPADAPVVDSALAHHLERAHQLYREVQPNDPGLVGLASRTVQALIRAGTRALHRKDLPAAIALLERGRDLLPEGDERHRVLAVRMYDAYTALGDWNRADRALTHAEDCMPGDGRTTRLAALLRQTLRIRSEGSHGADPDLEPDLSADRDDDLSWCRCLQLRALRHFSVGRLGEAEAAMRQALARTSTMNLEVAQYEAPRLYAAICELTQWSPTHAREGIALCTRLIPRLFDNRALLVPTLLTHARLLALADEVDEARSVLVQARTHVDELQLALGAAALEQVEGFIEGLSGKHDLARTRYEQAARQLDVLGMGGDATVSRINAAYQAFRAGAPVSEIASLRPASAEQLDTRGTALWWALEARVSASRGHETQMETAGRRAAEALARTDDPVLIGSVWFDLAQAMAELGQTTKARQAAKKAEASFRLKGARLLEREVSRWTASRKRALP
ncbi:adenylate/guanylate cyclase domain-containing protein [Streptomyces sp. NPDC006207]